MSKTVGQKIKRYSKAINISIFAVVLIGLYLTSLKSYLLFHSLAEIFSIVVAFSVFIIAWNSRNFIKNQYLLFIGIAYLFIGFLDLLHTLSYKGMPLFPDYDFYANQLWIGARYLESISLLAAFYYLNNHKPIQPYRLLAVFTIITTLLVLSIFSWKIFPVCFVADQGLTPFKKYSEYIICAILGLTIFFLHRNRGKFEPKVFSYLLWALIFTIMSELAFTVYISNYGFSNLVGHYFKIFSFLLVYLAIIKTGIENPFDLIFRELDTVNKQLHEEIETRKKTETDLKKALAEIKTLQGILPICCVCGLIRDDTGVAPGKGEWMKVDKFVTQKTDAQVSHGYCPKCHAKAMEDCAAMFSAVGSC